MSTNHAPAEDQSGAVPSAQSQHLLMLEALKAFHARHHKTNRGAKFDQQRTLSHAATLTLMFPDEALARVAKFRRHCELEGVIWTTQCVFDRVKSQARRKLKK